MEQITQYMNGFMAEELQHRAQLMARGEPEGPPLTILMDEAPAIIAALGKKNTSAWREWVREGWKFNLFLILLTQSTRVETLGISGEGDTLINFAQTFALGATALDEFPDVADHLERPAVMVIDGNRRAASPVIIPNITREMALQGRQSETPQLPIFTAPKPRGLSTPRGEVTPMQMQEIKRLHDLGWANARIEQHVFNQENPGGVAYYKVKAVLDFYANGGP